MHAKNKEMSMVPHVIQTQLTLPHTCSEYMQTHPEAHLSYNRNSQNKQVAITWVVKMPLG